MLKSNDPLGKKEIPATPDELSPEDETARQIQDRIRIMREMMKSDQF